MNLLARVQDIFNSATDYFDPTSNEGQNFWSGKTAKTLGDIQGVVKEQYRTENIAANLDPLKYVKMASSAYVYNPQTKQPLPQFQANINDISEINRLPIGPERNKKAADLVGSLALFMTSAPTSGGPMTPASARSILKVGKNSTQAEIKLATQELLSKEFPSRIKSLATRYKTNSANVVWKAADTLYQKVSSLPALTKTSPGGLSYLRTPQKGAYTNVRINDNPLLLGQRGVDQVKARLAGEPIEPAPQYTSGWLKADQPSAGGDGGYKNIERVQDTLDPDFTKVAKKVNWLDYFRTPENVLQKIGLSEQAKYLRTQYDSYISELPKEIKKLQEWQSEVPNKESARKIYDWLEGKPGVMSEAELKVANKVKDYLADWADKLELPQENRVSNYITRIFEKGATEAEFNDEIAKLIDKNVAGSVYNPFLMRRRGEQLDYVRDVWRALDAYIKRAVRKFYVDPALARLKDVSGGLEMSQFKYLQRLTARVNMRPTEVDTLIDNFIKTIPGIKYRFGQRPITSLTRGLRQQIYRGCLGLNISSATRNLTQGANTYAELGERWTVKGYIDLAKNWRSGELEEVGVLADSFLQDRQIGIYKKILASVDKGLFFLFEKAEKINRGACYYGAKARAINKGFSEEEAVLTAKALVRITQFTFGSIDTPAILSSDLMKTLLQFQSFNIKQGEFLINKVMKREFAGLFRYIGATLAFMYLLKKAFSMRLDILPVNLRAAPAIQLGTNVWRMAALKTGLGDEEWRGKTRSDLMKSIKTIIPAGVQGVKSYEGGRDVNRGYSASKTGLIRYPIKQSLANWGRGLGFGKYSFPEARQYYDNKVSILGKNQSAKVKQADDKLKAYQEVKNQKELDDQLKKVKELVETTGQSTWFDNKFLYLGDDGNVKTVDSSFQPKKPELTGNEKLDAKLISKYKSDNTKKQGDVVELYEQGQITAEEAEKARLKLMKARNTVTGTSTKAKTKSAKKITIKKLSPVKIKGITFSGRKPPALKLKSAPTIKIRGSQSAIRPNQIYDPLKGVSQL